MTVNFEGRVEYGGRAFLQDAEQAIKGDLVRALIELITNADDAYGQNPGPIEVRITKSTDAAYPLEVAVHDQAKGLTSEGLRKCFTVLGGKEAAMFDDGSGRGLLGRGAKDVASLGEISFAAIRDDAYSNLILRSDGSFAVVASDQPASADNRIQLRLPGAANGLTATVRIAKKHRMLSANKLIEQLQTHAQLRRLLDRREVRLFDERGAVPMVVLSYPKPECTLVLDITLTPVGYSDPVQLKVHRLAQRSQSNFGAHATHGLLIHSGVTTFENTWFGRQMTPEAAYFAGDIEAPQIAKIIRAYEDSDTELGGAVRLVDRGRDGLASGHPYTKALAKAVLAAVQPLLDDQAKQLNAGRKQGEKLDNALKAAGAALRTELNTILQEIEDEDAAVGPADEGGVATLALIPPRRTANPGEEFKLSVRVSGKAPASCSISVETSAPEGCVSVLESTLSEWHAHPRLDGFIATISVVAGDMIGTGVVRAVIDNAAAESTILIIEPTEVAPSIPTDLEFAAKKASVAPGKRRNLELRAPLEYVGDTVDIAQDPQVLGDCPSKVTLKANPSGLWAEATVRVKGVKIGDEATITACLYEQVAKATVTVAEGLGAAAPDTRFNLKASKNPLGRAAIFLRDGYMEVDVYGMHTSFAGVFGAYDDDAEKFSLEDSPRARAVLAETIAGQIAANLTERDAQKHPQAYNDAARVLHRHADIANRFVRILHRALEPVV